MHGTENVAAAVKRRALHRMAERSHAVCAATSGRAFGLQSGVLARSAPDGAPRNQERDAPVRRLHRGRRRQPGDRGRRVLHAARPLRLRQDHAAADDRRLRPPGRRQHLPRRRRSRRSAARSAPRPHGVPELRAVSAHDGRRERRVSAADGEDARAARSRARSRPRSRTCASSASASATRTSSRAARSSASRSRARSSPIRPCCCWTSRSPHSTRNCARRCRSSSSTCRQEVGITFVYVTHDQTEALALSHRIAVMNRGRVEQLDEPSRIYGFPRSRFVADFIGHCNLLSGPVAANAGGVVTVDVAGLGPVRVAAASASRAGKRRRPLRFARRRSGSRLPRPPTRRTTISVARSPSFSTWAT